MMKEPWALPFLFLFYPATYSFNIDELGRLTWADQGLSWPYTTQSGSDIVSFLLQLLQLY